MNIGVRGTLTCHYVRHFTNPYLSNSPPGWMALGPLWDPFGKWAFSGGLVCWWVVCWDVPYSWISW